MLQCRCTAELHVPNYEYACQVSTMHVTWWDNSSVAVTAVTVFSCCAQRIAVNSWRSFSVFVGRWKLAPVASRSWQSPVQFGWPLATGRWCARKTASYRFRILTGSRWRSLIFVFTMWCFTLILLLNCILSWWICIYEYEMNVVYYLYHKMGVISALRGEFGIFWESFFNDSYKKQ